MQLKYSQAWRLKIFLSTLFETYQGDEQAGDEKSPWILYEFVKNLSNNTNTNNI